MSDHAKVSAGSVASGRPINAHDLMRNAVGFMPGRAWPPTPEWAWVESVTHSSGPSESVFRLIAPNDGQAYVMVPSYTFVRIGHPEEWRENNG